MFDMERDVGNVFGTSNFASEDIRNRYIPTQMRQNELPTTQIRVGPGLNQGYGWKPSGGLNQPNTRDFVMPKDTNQLYGKLVKLFCITASGAEGISLKNVRRVLITEPYWNNIRIDQVIGRAIRSCSHETLLKNTFQFYSLYI